MAKQARRPFETTRLQMRPRRFADVRVNMRLKCASDRADRGSEVVDGDRLGVPGVDQILRSDK